MLVYLKSKVMQLMSGTSGQGMASLLPPLCPWHTSTPQECGHGARLGEPPRATEEHSAEPIALDHPAMDTEAMLQCRHKIQTRKRGSATLGFLKVLDFGSSGCSQ